MKMLRTLVLLLYLVTWFRLALNECGREAYAWSFNAQCASCVQITEVNIRETFEGENFCKFSDCVAVHESFRHKIGGCGTFVSDTSEQSLKVHLEDTYPIAGDFRE